MILTVLWNGEPIFISILSLAENLWARNKLNLVFPVILTFAPMSWLLQCEQADVLTRKHVIEKLDSNHS